MRADLTRPDHPEWRRLLFPCTSDDHHFLLLEWWADDDGFEGYLGLVPCWWVSSLWGRIKAAVRILTGRRHYWGGLLLNAETTFELMETLDEYLGHETAKQVRRLISERGFGMTDKQMSDLAAEVMQRGSDDAEGSEP